METWPALMLKVKDAAATLDKHYLLGMSGMTPTFLWRPVQGLLGNSNCSWRTSNKNGLNLECITFQMNLDRILNHIGTKPALIHANVLEVDKGIFV